MLPLSQLQALVKAFLSPDSPLRINPDLDEATLHRLPLVAFIDELLHDLLESPIKLTKTGNFPRQYVIDMYASGLLPDRHIESGLTKLRTQQDYLPADLVRHLPQIAGWTKVRQGKLSLTKKGEAALELPPAEFLTELLTVHVGKFNMGWSDGYPEAGILQIAFPYLLYLLHRDGPGPVPLSSLTEEWLAPFNSDPDIPPGTNTIQLAHLRFVARFLYYYGLAEDKQDFYDQNARLTELFYEVFQLAGETLPTEEEEYNAAVSAALFDAETGGHTHIVPGAPPEVVQQFFDQIRADLESDEERITVRELLGEIYLVPPEEIPDAPTARREIDRFLALLEDKGVVTGEPEGIPPLEYYAILYRALPEQPVLPYAEKRLQMIPFEELMDSLTPPTLRVTSDFLLSLLHLEQPFPEALLAPVMRRRNVAVPREAGLAYIREWRAGFSEFRPLDFAPLDKSVMPAQAFPDQEIEVFEVAYEARFREDGRREVMEGQGIVELVLVEGAWLVSGASFPGFEL